MWWSGPDEQCKAKLRRSVPRMRREMGPAARQGNTSLPPRCLGQLPPRSQCKPPSPPALPLGRPAPARDAGDVASSAEGCLSCPCCSRPRGACHRPAWQPLLSNPRPAPAEAPRRANAARLTLKPAAFTPMASRQPGNSHKMEPNMGPALTAIINQSPPFVRQCIYTAGEQPEIQPRGCRQEGTRAWVRAVTHTPVPCPLARGPVCTLTCSRTPRSSPGTPALPSLLLHAPPGVHPLLPGSLLHTHFPTCTQLTNLYRSHQLYYHH